jgi:hypothetical protein
MMLKYIILLAVCIAAFETVGASAETTSISDKSVPELIAVLNDPVKQRLESWTVYEVIRLLGKTKGNMAIEALVDNIGYPDCLKPCRRIERNWNTGESVV